MTTKERILAAVGVIFMKEDVEGITMKKVADQAGIGKSTVYEYFESKDRMIAEAIIYVSNQFIDAFYQNSWKRENLNFEERLKLSIQQILTAFKGEIGKFIKLMEETNANGHQNYLRSGCRKELMELQLKSIEYTKVLIQQGQDEGVLRDDLVEMDIVNFQRVFLVLCAGFSGKADFLEGYVQSVEDREAYIYDRLLCMFKR